MSLGGQRDLTFLAVARGVCDRNGETWEDLTQGERLRLQRELQWALEYIWMKDQWPHLRRIRELTPVEGLLAWDEIGLPKRVYGYDPRGECRTGKVYSFTMTGEGLHLHGRVDTDAVWVEDMPPCPSLKGDDWDEGTAYAAGDQVFYEAKGDYFRAAGAIAAGVAPGAAASWVRVEIPALFGQYLVWSAHAGLLGSERQSRERVAAEKRAEDFLMDAIEAARGVTGLYEQAIGGGFNR